MCGQAGKHISTLARITSLLACFGEALVLRGDDLLEKLPPPRMLVMQGCSGSTAVIEQARDMLAIHNVLPTMPSEAFPDAEMLKPEKNPYYEEANHDIGKSLELATLAAQSRSPPLALLFKGMVEEVVDPRIWEENHVLATLNELRAVAVFASRFNMLDQLVCQVKDCFHPEYGVPADDSGASQLQDSHKCILRRQGANSFRAKLFPDTLIEGIDHQYEVVERARKALNASGIPALEVVSEDLFDYEMVGDVSAFVRAVEAWSKFLTSWGVKPVKEKVEAVLMMRAHSRSNASKHSEVIHNFDAVREVLVQSKHAHLLRE